MEQLTARVREGTISRLDALIPHVERLPALQAVLGGKANQTVVLRLAIERGLAALEAEVAEGTQR